jgi:hypothetical protein
MSRGNRLAIMKDKNFSLNSKGDVDETGEIVQPPYPARSTGLVIHSPFFHLTFEIEPVHSVQPHE